MKRCSIGKLHLKKRSPWISERLDDPGTRYSIFYVIPVKWQGKVESSLERCSNLTGQIQWMTEFLIFSFQSCFSCEILFCVYFNYLQWVYSLYVTFIFQIMTSRRNADQTDRAKARQRSNRREHCRVMRENTRLERECRPLEVALERVNVSHEVHRLNEERQPLVENPTRGLTGPICRSGVHRHRVDDNWPIGHRLWYRCRFQVMKRSFCMCLTLFLGFWHWRKSPARSECQSTFAQQRLPQSSFAREKNPCVECWATCNHRRAIYSR